MTSAYVSQPSMFFPEHSVSLREIEDDIARTHAHLPNLKVVLRTVRATGVLQRRFARPLAEVSASEPIAERNAHAFKDVCRMGEQAAITALTATGLSPGDIDCVITSHATGISMPGLDVHLIGALSLRPDVRRIPVTQLGCAGAAYAMIRASEYLRARPGEQVLVVCAEAVSSVYQHSDSTIESMIFKGLFGDGAAAVIVTSDPLGPGIRIEDTKEITLPHTANRYRMETQQDGFHFLSTRAALDSTKEMLPYLLPWYRGESTDAEFDFVIGHPGGPRVLNDLETGLDLSPGLLRHSRESMARRGNLAGPAVFDVLNRHYSSAPEDGAKGIVLGLGPGFTGAACKATWTS
jgi:predicted naringenin-chalcone synthase